MKFFPLAIDYISRSVIYFQQCLIIVDGSTRIALKRFYNAIRDWYKVPPNLISIEDCANGCQMNLNGSEKEGMPT